MRRAALVRLRCGASASFQRGARVLSTHLCTNSHVSGESEGDGRRPDALSALERSISKDIAVLEVRPLAACHPRCVTLTHSTTCCSRSRPSA
jgi:hypothetical protein